MKTFTVEAALRNEAHSLSCIFQSNIDRFVRSEKKLDLIVKVSMEYIPSFEETIPMLLVEGSKILNIMSEIRGEVKQMEKQLSSLA